jgi:hypothetical protein
VRSESLGPSHSVRVTRSESLGPSHSVRVTRSESLGPSHSVRATRSESLGPSHSVRVTRSESLALGPSHLVRVTRSESLGPSHSIRVTGTRSESLGPSPAPYRRPERDPSRAGRLGQTGSADRQCRQAVQTGSADRQRRQAVHWPACQCRQAGSDGRASSSAEAPRRPRRTDSFIDEWLGERGGGEILYTHLKPGASLPSLAQRLRRGTFAVFLATTSL